MRRVLVIILVSLMYAGCNSPVQDKPAYAGFLNENFIYPLHYAAIHIKNPEIITALINGGADLNAKDESGYTPLHRAAWSNKNPEIITALLDAGADPKAKNKSGQTAWYYIKDTEALKDTEVYQRLKRLTIVPPT